MPTIATVAASSRILLDGLMPRLRAFRALDLDVLVCCPDDGPTDRFEHEGFTHVRIPSPSGFDPGRWSVAWLLLNTAFVEHQPIIVHSHSEATHLPAAAAARSARVPISVATLRDLDAAGALAPLQRHCHGLLGKISDAWLVCNTGHATKARAHMPEDKIHTLSAGLGVEIAAFRPAVGKPEARRRLRLPPETRQVGFTGRLTERSAGDLPTILDKLQLAEPDVGVILTLIGPGDPNVEAAIGRRIEDGRSIVVVKDRSPEERALIYEATDVQLVPTRQTSAARDLMEAAAVGVPSVAFDTPGTRDLLRPGRTGQLAPAGDLQCFVDDALSLLRSPSGRRDMGKAARMHAESHFEANKARAQVFALYDRLIDARGLRG